MSAWQKIGGIGSPIDFVDAHAYVVDMARIDDSHFIIVYTDDDSGETRAVIATMAGNSVVFGNAYTVKSSASQSLQVAILDSTHAIITYAAYNSAGYAKIATISGSEISFGSEYSFRSGSTGEVKVAPLDSTHAIITYRYSSSGRARVATISGSSISYGTEKTFTGSYFDRSDIDTLSSSAFIISYSDTLSHIGTAIVGTVSGSAITFGSEYTYSSNDVLETTVCAIDSTHAMIGNHNYYIDGGEAISSSEALIATISGTAISFGIACQFESEQVFDLSIIKIASDRCLICYTIGDVFLSYYRYADIDGDAISYGAKQNISGNPETIAGVMINGIVVLGGAYEYGYKLRVVSGDSSWNRCKNLQYKATTFKRTQL